MLPRVQSQTQTHITRSLLREKLTGSVWHLPVIAPWKFSVDLLYSPVCEKEASWGIFFWCVCVCVPFPSGWFTLPREQCGKHKPQLSSSSTLTLLSTFSHISMVSIQCVFVCLEHILKPKPKKFWFRFYLNKNWIDNVIRAHTTVTSMASLEHFFRLWLSQLVRPPTCWAMSMHSSQLKTGILVYLGPQICNLVHQRSRGVIIISCTIS